MRSVTSLLVVRPLMVNFMFQIRPLSRWAADYSLLITILHYLTVLLELVECSIRVS